MYNHQHQQSTTKSVVSIIPSTSFAAENASVFGYVDSIQDLSVFPCLQCHFSATDTGSLLLHLASEHSIAGEVQCCVCVYCNCALPYSPSQKVIKRHLKWLHPRQPQSFDLRTEYLHLDEDGKFECPKCAMKLDTLEDVGRHAHLHLPPSVVQQFKTEPLITDASTLSPPTECLSENSSDNVQLSTFLDCSLAQKGREKQCSTKSARSRRYYDYPPSECDICKRIFRFKFGLKTHLRVHTGEQPYKCKMCGKTFSQSENLKRHKRRHCPKSCMDPGSQVDDLNSGDESAAQDVPQEGMNKSVYEESSSSEGVLPSENIQISLESEQLSPREKGLLSSSCNEKEMIQQSISMEDPEIHCTPSVNIGDGVESKESQIESCQANELKVRIETDEREYPFVCADCGKGFRLADNLDKHNMFVHKRQLSYCCEQCGKGFTDASCLNSHVLLHVGERPLKCEQGEEDNAGKDFKRANNPKVLMDKFPYRCEVCKKGFRQSCRLKNHQQLHTGEYPFKCEECGKGFSRADRLNVHKVSVHTGEFLYYCAECKKGFMLDSLLKTHMLQHTGERPFKCEECGKGFTSANCRKIHKLMHTGEQPVECEECGKCFSHSGNLAKHRRMHTGERPFKCIVCGICYAQSNHLKAHLVTHIHVDKLSSFQCETCGKCFTKYNALKLHSTRHADTQYPCKRCGKGFTGAGGLKLHMMIHTGEFPYKCEQCSKGFCLPGDVKRHMRKHANRRQLKCEQCGKEFMYVGRLGRHMMVQHGTTGQMNNV